MPTKRSKRDSATRFARVPAKPFQERYILLHRTEGLTFYEVASRMGYAYRNGITASEVMGIKLDDSGQPYVAEPDKTINYSVAMRLMFALNLDPFECGL